MFLKVVLRNIINNIIATSKGPTSRDEYFSRMEEVGRLSHEWLTHHICDEFPDSKIRDVVAYFLHKRTGRRPMYLKPLVVILAYEISGGSDWKSILPVAACCELINISSYQSNASFDAKYGLLNSFDRDNQVIASFLIREKAEKMLIHLGVPNRVLELVSEINSNIYLGQFHELNTLHVRNIELSQNLRDYLALYLEKCRTISGIFTKNCMAIGAYLGNSGNSQISQSLEAAGMAYGIALNIINDMSDYILPEEGCTTVYKTERDQFSDPRNGRVFLPIFYAYSKGDSSTKDFLLKVLNGSIIIDKQNYTRLQSILIEKGGLSFSFAVAKRLMKQAKQSIRSLPSCQEKIMISVMFSGVRTNKFIHMLRKAGMLTKCSDELEEGLLVGDKSCGLIE